MLVRMRVTGSSLVLWNSLMVSYKIGPILPYYLAVLLLDIYTKEMKIIVHIETCIQRFTGALFTTAKTKMQVLCPYK